MHTESKSFSSVHLVIILVVGLISLWYTYEPKVELLGDNGDYYTLSKALAQGEGYVLLSHPEKVKNNHYPPGYPALLSPIMLITGGSIMAAKMFNCALFLGSLILVYLISSIWTSRIWAFVITIFIALNSHVLFYASIMMSEVPFLFFSLLTIYTFLKIRRKFSWGDKYIYVSLIALVITYYIRALGIGLLFGIIVHLLVQQRWKQGLFYLMGLVLCAMPWMIRSSNLGGSSYINQLKMVNPYQPSLGEADLSDFISRIGENLERYLSKEIPAALYPAMEANYQQGATGGEYIFGLILIVTGVIGFWQIKDFRFLILGYLIATFGILMLWPQVWIGVRFIVPIIPFFYVGLASFMAWILHKKLSLPKEDWKPYLSLILIIPLLSTLNELHADAESPYHPAWRSYFSAAEWIRNNTEKDAVIATGKPQLFYLYSNRTNIRYLFTENQEELIDHLKKNSVDYVIIDQVYGNTLRYMLPVVQEQRSRFEVVHQVKNPDTFVLKLK